MVTRTNWIRMGAIALLAASIVLFFASLFLVAFCFDPALHIQIYAHLAAKGTAWACYGGAGLLGFGGIYMLPAILMALGLTHPDPGDDFTWFWANMTWLANPLLVVGWFRIWFDKRWASILFCLAATITAGAFALMPKVLIPLNEMAPGVQTAITSLGPGYWVWLASIVTALVAALLNLRIKPVPSADSSWPTGRPPR
jgi:hypothetical protein